MIMLKIAVLYSINGTEAEEWYHMCLVKFSNYLITKETFLLAPFSDIPSLLF